LEADVAFLAECVEKHVQAGLRLAERAEAAAPDEAVAAARSKMRPFVAPNDDTLRAALAAAYPLLLARIAKLEARLEIDHCFTLVGEEMVREEIPAAERDSFIDGISCRDETIKLLYADNAELLAEIAKLREALMPFRKIVEGWSKQHLSGHVEDDDLVYARAGDLRAADAALGKQ
jgi:hypothetical protein